MNVLPRTVGVPGAVLLGLGSMLGTGVFVGVALAAEVAGPWVVPATLLAAACVLATTAFVAGWLAQLSGNGTNDSPKRAVWAAGLCVAAVAGCGLVGCGSLAWFVTPTAALIVGGWLVAGGGWKGMMHLRGCAPSGRG